MDIHVGTLGTINGTLALVTEVESGLVYFQTRNSFISPYSADAGMCHLRSGHEKAWRQPHREGI